MASQWFTKRGQEEKLGPFGDAELKQRAVNGTLWPTDYVWREGMPQAVSASTIKGLFPQQSPVSLPTIDPNSFDAMLAGQVPVQQTAGVYTPNAAAQQAEPETEEDVFTWYRPGDPRAPIMVKSVTFWRWVHSIGSKYKAFYFLLPVMIALPFGFLLGAITAFNPFYALNWIAFFIFGCGFGEMIFQCFRLAKIDARPLSIGYGVLVGLVVCYFFLAGECFNVYNRNAPKESPTLTPVGAVMPTTVAWYVKANAEAMTVGKITHSTRLEPNRYLNYLFIFGELGIILISVASGAGGGLPNAGKKRSSDDDEEENVGYRRAGPSDDELARMYGIGRF